MIKIQLLNSFMNKSLLTLHLCCPECPDGVDNYGTELDSTGSTSRLTRLVREQTNRWGWGWTKVWRLRCRPWIQWWLITHYITENRGENLLAVWRYHNPWIHSGVVAREGFICLIIISESISKWVYYMLSVWRLPNCGYDISPHKHHSQLLVDIHSP